jgi:hypothetical protein
MIHVPLAEDCNTTFYLKKVNLRNEAYYFDWIIISPEVILSFFLSDFKDYLKLENLEELPQSGELGFVGFKPTKIRVVDKVWKVRYLHHFNYLEKDFIEVKRMFDKRIERLNSHFKKNDSVMFYYEHTDSDIGIDNPFNYGKEVMKMVFPELKNYLLNKYSYSNDKEISIKYIGTDIEDEVEETI